MKKILFTTTLLISVLSVAQIHQGEVNVGRAEDIEQGNVTVKRKYEPNVEAAEKIKQTPKVATAVEKKYQPQYEPKDVKAASDFETTTISADQLPVDNGENYSNYFEVGYGNNANLLMNAFVGINRDENSSFGVNAGYRSAKAKLDESIVDDGFYEFNADGFYRYNLDNAMAKVGVGTRISSYDLYGYRPAVSIEEIQPEKSLTYTNINAYGIYDEFNSYWLDEVKAEYDYFNNNHSSNENDIKLNAIVGSNDLFDFSLLGSESLGLTAEGNLEYLSTDFNTTFQEQEKDYRFFNTGVVPQLVWGTEMLDVAAGANIQYLSDNGDDESKVYVAPQIEVNVKPIPEIELKGGINGGVDVRSFKELATYNPYLYNHQQMKPEITKIGIYVGINGDINADFKYALSAGYQDLENIMGYFKLPLEMTEVAPYGKGNSFHTYYDDGNRSYVDAEINYFGLASLDLTAKLSYEKIDLDHAAELFEVPEFTADMGATYKMLNQRLKLGADFIFTGSRTGWEGTNLETGEEIDLDSYVDLNLNARYSITDQFTVFVDGQNLINSHYKRFTDYRVQGLHVIGGIMFQF